MAERYSEKKVCIDKEIEDVMNQLPENPSPIKRVSKKSENKWCFSSDDVV